MLFVYNLSCPGEYFVAFSAVPGILSFSLYALGVFVFVTMGTGLKAVLMNFAADQISPEEVHK